jgi:hypothetical protein
MTLRVLDWRGPLAHPVPRLVRTKSINAANESTRTARTAQKSWDRCPNSGGSPLSGTLLL